MWDSWCYSEDMLLIDKDNTKSNEIELNTSLSSMSSIPVSAQQLSFSDIGRLINAGWLIDMVQTNLISFTHAINLMQFLSFILQRLLITILITSMFSGLGWRKTSH